jgi:hypothetical protein
MILLPILIKVGLFAAVMLTLHFILPATTNINNDKSKTHSMDDVISVNKPSLINNGSDIVHDIQDVDAVDLNSNIKQIVVIINNEQYVFKYIESAITYGDLAAEFCRNHGTYNAFFTLCSHWNYLLCVTRS